MPAFGGTPIRRGTKETWMVRVGRDQPANNGGHWYVSHLISLVGANFMLISGLTWGLQRRYRTIKQVAKHYHPELVLLIPDFEDIE